MKNYKNYIFDLYGTLIDIRTNEESAVLWKRMADMYAVYGADWNWRGLKKRYSEMVREEEAKLSADGKHDFPEIKLEKVSMRLYNEAPERHEAETPVSNREEWAAYIANFFRIESRRNFTLFDYTIPLLKSLKEHGRRIYLLSNAQRVFTYPEMEVMGLTQYFDDIFISSDLSTKKPDPGFMRALINKHDLKTEESVMIGNDLISDMGTACACGMDGIYINTFKNDAEKNQRLLAQMKLAAGEYNADAADWKPVLSLETEEVIEGILW